MTDDASKLNFGAAMQELEGILSRVESEEIDIDELAEELKRAAELLELCRGKIRRAEVEVSQVVQTLEEPANETASEPTGEPEAPSEPLAEPEGAEDAATTIEQATGTTASLFENDG